MSLRLLPYQEHHLRVNKRNFGRTKKHSDEIPQEVNQEKATKNIVLVLSSHSSETARFEGAGCNISVSLFHKVLQIWSYLFSTSVVGKKIHQPILLYMDEFLDLYSFGLIVPFIFWDQLHEIHVRFFYLIARLVHRIFSLLSMVDVYMIKS